MKTIIALKTGIAATILTAAGATTPALADDTGTQSIKPQSSGSCMLVRDGFKWNLCTDDRVSRRIPLPVAAAIPAPVNPTEDEEPENENIGLMIDGGGGDGGRD